MHQRQPIKVEKGRAFPASNNGPVASSTQGSFHKIYRKKRCYLLMEKEQDRRGSSPWKADHVISQRDDTTTSQSHHFPGPSNLKFTRRTDSVQSNHYGNHPVSLSKRESARIYQQHLKRPNDRVRFNSVPGPEFDGPSAKKHKVECHDSPYPRHNYSPETGQDKQKMVLEDTKWMYKNQHGKMSGPYGVRQLMEGFYAHFLQEDLPLFQFHEGKLGRQLTLKQLIEDLESCSPLIHSPPSRINQSVGKKGFVQGVSVQETEEDMDLPPGFGGIGGHNPHVSERSSFSYRHRSTTFSSPSSDFEAAELGLPPGFDAIARKESLAESYISELEYSRRFSTGAGVSSGWSEDIEGMQCSYEKFEPVVRGRNQSAHQGSSPHSKMNFMMQGGNSLNHNLLQPESMVHNWGQLCQQDGSPSPRMNCTLQGMRVLNEHSSMHTTWVLRSPNTKTPNVETQSFSSPRVCIGLPVSMAYAQGANNGLLPKESSDFSATCGISPLDLIYSELLTAVKRSYAKTVLSALIDEQLKCWVPGKDDLRNSLLPEDDSRSREASSLSSPEFGVVSLESNGLKNGASTCLPRKLIGSAEPSLHLQAFQSSDDTCLDAHTGPFGVFLEARVAECIDGSGLTDQSVHIEEQQCLSMRAFGTRNAGNRCTAFALTDVSSPSQNSSEINKVPLVKESLESGLDKADSFLSCDETSTKSLKPASGTIAESFGKVVLDQREEMQHQVRDGIVHKGSLPGKAQLPGSSLDAAYMETQPSFLVYGRRKWKMKSLKCLMQNTSEPSTRDTKISSSSTSKKEEVSMGTAQETLVQNKELISEDCWGCARTAVDNWLWQKVGCRAPSKHGSSLHSQSDAPTLMHHLKFRSFSAAANASFIPKLTRSEAKLKLARSKIHGWGIFAIEPVEAGDFVIEYVGEVVRPRVADSRERHYRNFGFGCSFLFRVNCEMVVDATKQGSFARFMNYSCEPNCYSKIVSLGGSKKVFIYAKKHIVSGEELTYDCKFELEDQKIPCNCGSARCRNPPTDMCK